MFDSSFITYNDHITGERFFSLNTSQVYCYKIETVYDFLIKNISLLDKNFIILTHNGDLPVTQDLLNIAKQNPCFKMWYGQNINCYDSKVQSIPLGLENSEHFPDVKKRERLLTASLRSGTKKPSKMVYMNFSFWTNPQIRYSCYNNFKNINWVTDSSANVVSQQNYQEWIESVLDHHYVLCPQGNGIDTHRLWETLYLGRIPIVQRNYNTTYYEDLPILFVNDWSEITIDLLEKSLEKFGNESNFNLNKMKFSWWVNEISKSIND